MSNGTQIRPVQLDVIKTNDTHEMETEINKRLKLGFLFHGDLKVVASSVGLNYVQAMIKVEPVTLPSPSPARAPSNQGMP